MLKYFFKRFEKKEVGERAANHPLPLSLSFFLSSRPLIENEFRYAEDRVSFFLSPSFFSFFTFRSRFVISWNGGDVDYVNFKFSSRVCNIFSYVYSMFLLEITIVKLE